MTKQLSLYVSDVAKAYYPGYNRYNAVRQLRQEIKEDPLLREKLEALYFQPYQRAFTPRQYAAVVEVKGDPND